MPASLRRHAGGFDDRRQLLVEDIHQPVSRISAA
jgi:hypothetical protein